MLDSGVANLQKRFFFHLTAHLTFCCGFQFIYTWIRLLVSVYCRASPRIQAADGRHFLFYSLNIILDFLEEIFFNDYSSWYYFSFQLQCGYTPAHCYFVNGCICLLLIDSPNRTQMLAFRLCIILLACHQAGPMPANTLCLPEAQWPCLVYPDTCANQHACLRLCFLGRS